MNKAKAFTPIAIALAALFSGCAPANSASPATNPEATPPPASTTSVPEVGSAAAPRKEEKASAIASSANTQVSAPSTPESQSPQACPSDMILVAGDYCSDVQHVCKKEWFSEANKKRVCEEFEPHSKCVGTKTPKRFCIDKYSWPNVAGERPEVMNNFYQAQVKCAAIGKRLCTESEWTMSCEGPDMLPFPYGYVRDTTKCNGDREWDNPDMVKVAKRDPDELARLWQGVPNGGQPQCVSGYGVYDLAGNTDDVVQSETTVSGYKGKYDSVHTGGPWYRGVRNQCRPKIYTHNEGFYYYFLGFRCCAEADGAPTDPRGPKQIARGWDIERIERMARFTRQQVREKLQQKENGKCECADSDTLCKTMCGTLLGPNAKDVVLQPPK